MTRRRASPEKACRLSCAHATPCIQLAAWSSRLRLVTNSFRSSHTQGFCIQAGRLMALLQYIAADIRRHVLSSGKTSRGEGGEGGALGNPKFGLPKKGKKKVDRAPGLGSASFSHLRKQEKKIDQRPAHGPGRDRISIPSATILIQLPRISDFVFFAQRGWSCGILMIAASPCFFSQQKNTRRRAPGHEYCGPCTENFCGGSLQFWAPRVHGALYALVKRAGAFSFWSPSTDMAAVRWSLGCDGLSLPEKRLHLTGRQPAFRHRTNK